jgi:hypothetical protein
VTEPCEILRQGRSTLDPVLYAHDFSFKDGGSGVGSGGRYAFGSYVNKDRRLELHFRFSLGLVTYHFGKNSLDHESYMRALLATAGGTGNMASPTIRSRCLMILLTICRALPWIS